MSKQDLSRDKFPRKFGKYHLLAPLAQGGMGALYLAVTGDRGLERLLVIKTVLPHLADQEYVARFRDEAKVVVKLSHGNIVPVFDAGQVDGELFVAMDFVEGKDLRAVWNRCAQKGVAFPIDVAAYIAKELSRGLAYAHSFGDLKLVHRDVSPPNVLLSYSGEVKLTDFGLASSTLKLEKTAPGIIYGKVAYMSPEQARGEPLDGRSDLYAAGIILWELLTGRQLYPPSKEQPQDLMKRAREPNLVPPSQRAPRVPPELDAICLKALAPQREDRYADGAELRKALAGWLAKNAPGTDAARLETFISGLFAEDIGSERREREALIEKTRDRAKKTLPPSDELRRMLEQDGGDVDQPIAPARTSGRRAEDHGDAPRDRRQQPGRRSRERSSHAPQKTVRGIAVDVPPPGPGGRTVVPSDSRGAALAEAEAVEVSAQGSVEAVMGQVLDGRYRIRELIGEGGMGRVYLAEHVEIGKRVAVKILHPVYGRMPDLVERFRREARAASRIGHPHIVDVTDSGTTEDESVYFVMEYLDGVELAAVIDREGALDIPRALRIATQICRALAAAHAARIIHRDLKPENVYLTVREGTSDFVKVLDFGIAKTTEAEEARAKRLTSPGMAMGTPEYMAPEQAAGRPADARCDVYALGAILYEMLTGSPPYEGENFMEILTKKATIDPPPPRTVRPEIPEPVERLVMQAMARDPADRPPSMEAFEYELTKCLSGRGAAVAKMLGMRTDPGVVASLNPGLPARVEADFDGPDGPATSPTWGGGTWPGGPGTWPGSSPGTSARYNVAGMDLVQAGTGVGASSSPGEDVDGSAGRSRGALFGWLVFGLLLAAGVGAVLYVVRGEYGGANGTAVAGQSPAAAARSTAPLGPSGAASLAGAAKAVSPPARDTGAKVRAPSAGAPAPRERHAGQEHPQHRSGHRARAPESPAHHSSRQVATLLRRARRLQAQMKWKEARKVYEQVVASHHHRAAGLLGIANVAFQTEHLDDAIRYAQRALAAGAGDAARILLGHVYYKQGHYRWALRYYDAVLKDNPGNQQAQRSAAAARRRLGLGQPGAGGKSGRSH